MSGLEALHPDFAARIATGCWTWHGAFGGDGHYGAAMVDGKLVVTHRYVYELLVGPIPKGLEIDHLCQNTRCCNPEHLEPVTHAENLRRGYLRRFPRTHCANGHEMTPENTYEYANARVCRTCTREKGRKYREQLRANGRVQNRQCTSIVAKGAREGKRCSRPALIGGTLCHCHEPTHAARRAARAAKALATIRTKPAS